MGGTGLAKYSLNNSKQDVLTGQGQDPEGEHWQAELEVNRIYSVMSRSEH